jgi:hypothetical protein
MREGILASVGDAYDNALAESTIGLFKTEAMAKNNLYYHGPFKAIVDIPPAEFEVNYYVATMTPQQAMSHT